MKISKTKNLITLLLLAILSYSSINAFGQIKSERINAKTFDASSLDWKLWGYRPNSWRLNFDFNNFTGSWAEIPNVPFTMPGSVQNALKNVGILPDWTIGINNTACEWVDNRHWIIVAKIPDNWLPKEDEQFSLNCDGIDYRGILMVNGKEAGQFSNAFLPHLFNLKPFLKPNNNTIAFVFESQPQNLAQIGWTSKIAEWKPRFNYGWDWIPRIVQIGIFEKVYLNAYKEFEAEINNIQILTDADKSTEKGELRIKVDLNTAAQSDNIKVTLTDSEGKLVFVEQLQSIELLQQKVWKDLKIKRWWPNGHGKQNLYQLQVSLLDEKNNTIQTITQKVGFKNTQWLPCQDAKPNAEPWICSINNQPFFLQGVNWTPIRPNFADLKEADYRMRLAKYKELGINIIRVWGGGFPEKDWLYDMCDEMGILVWQDFPMSSSGCDNTPPETPEAIYDMTQIVKRYVSRLQPHASFLLWCGGNELYNKENTAPITDKHPMISEMKQWIKTLDPGRKWVDGTPSGPTIYAELDKFGTGDNWDVHGPWQLPYTATDRTMNAVKDFWAKDDALFHSEVGVPGAMSAETINKYRGDFNPLPASIENPIWRNVCWWVEWDDFKYDHNGQATNSLEEYVNWSQKRQSEGLSIALKSCKDRFPRCGGFIIWMGHDAFPCMVNTSIMDFDGNLKPAAIAVSKIWKENNNCTYVPKVNNQLKK